MNKNENKNLVSKPPVVVVLGHVDHGKSSLLENIKGFEIKITEKESGGITQHIGAYEIEHQNKKITFIDTPGHEAFSVMRSRGAKVADIAILVVAADEGIKPQTKEAISHIKKSGVSLIVAINKIDKPGADPEKIKRELIKENILVESMGGKIPSVNVSAKTGAGISELLELILLISEIENLKTDVSANAEGVVIESYLDNFRGPIATIILNQGKLNIGQIIGTHSSFGKIKNLENFYGVSISEAFPSQPVIVLGFEKTPRLGEKIKVFANIEEAKKNLKTIERKIPELINVGSEQKILNLILKTDVLGSLEVIEEILKELPQDKIVLRILNAEIGEVTESDVKLAIQAKAKILSFRTKINSTAKILAEREKIKIMQFDVIYNLVEGVKNFMEKFLESKTIRIDLGKIKTLLIFSTEKNRQIIGGRVIEGEIKKGSLIEVQRGEEIVGHGKLINLQRDRKDIERAGKREEVGISYEGNVKIEENDILLIYTEQKQK